MMLHFRNDYSEGACEAVMQAVAAVNLECCVGYGEDAHTKRAKELIRALCAAPRASVELFIGGTNVNVVGIAALLRPWEGVIAPESGHINGHESGAMEALGHKILALPTGADGKLLPEQIPPLMQLHTDVHLVKPRLVYISNATERGAVYTKAELAALSAVCRAHDLLLFLDGARLGVALACAANDVSFADLAQYCDAFTIGGTKNGALMGEALVIPEGHADIFRFKKQQGGVLAKGFLLGAQFEVLMQEQARIYLENAAHANACAQELQRGLEDLGVELFCKSQTNQIFAIFSAEVVEKMREFVDFEEWERLPDARIAIRFVCSFAVKMEDIATLLMQIGELT